MGLINAPATFMQIMNDLFMDILDKGLVFFLDDILIYSAILEAHFELLEKVFSCSSKYRFYCKLKKCSFLLRITTFLGFGITPQGLKISNRKLQGLKEWPKPTTI